MAALVLMESLLPLVLWAAPPAGKLASTWPSECAGLERPPPLSLEAAREAHRWAERRHALRLREAAMPGSFLAEMHARLDALQLAAGKLCLAEVAERGQLLFEHEYTLSDGLGGAVASGAAGPFRRVHQGLFGGPETISCPSCHWVGGPNGAGSEADNAFLSGDGERVRSGDERNPQALMGLGVVQALAGEMSRELQRQSTALRREAARAGAVRETRLVAKGVEFGVLRATPGGDLDTSGVSGVDADLVVKPFGWKGTAATIADFSAEALQVHIGIQSDEILETAAPAVLGVAKDRSDPDGDGRRHELGAGPFTAMLVHLALLEMPLVEPLIQNRQVGPAARALLAPTTTSFVGDFVRGREQFRAIGCADCHRPMLVLEKAALAVDGAPPLDLAQQMRRPALVHEPQLGGYPVWLFSDLKRHDMGKANAAQHVQRGVAREQYLTARLWGVADSAPYLHDGRAPSLDYAIAGHDGEAAAARAAYTALDPEAKGALRVYLMSMRRAPRVIVP